MNRMTALLAAAALAGAAGTAQAQTTLRFSNFLPGTMAYSPVFTEFAEAVTKESNGTVKVEMFHGGTLGGNALQQLKLVQDGVAQMAFVITSYSPGRFPELEVGELPFVLRTSREGALAFNSQLAKKQLPSMAGLKVLAITNSGLGNFHTAKLVTKPEDVKGLRIRVAGGTVSDIVKLLGGAPVLLGGPEMAEAMARGTIDGMVVEPFTITSWKLEDKAVSHMMVKLGGPIMTILMREDTYEKLPAQGRAAIDKYAGRWVSERWAANLDNGNEDALAKLKARPGNTVTMPDAAAQARWEAALKPVTDAWLAKRPENPALLARFQDELKAIRGGN